MPALVLGAGCTLLARGELDDRPDPAGGGGSGGSGGGQTTSTSDCGPLDTLDNCGACGKACDPANAVASCAGGICAIQGCLGKLDDCNQLVDDGCETDTATDPSHCGSCGHPCSVSHGTPACVASACAIGSCTAPFDDCDDKVANGCEVNTSVDLQHCGGCGKVCKAQNGGASCNAGVCQLSCDPSFGDCNGDGSDGCEAPLDTSQHCGSCGVTCPAGRACANSACTPGWLGMSSVNAPAPRMMAAAAWIGRGMFVWSGTNGTSLLADGAVYDPVTDAWTAVSHAGAPAPRVLAGMVSAGAHVVVWGGADEDGGTPVATGGRYTPAPVDAWLPMSVSGAPAARQQPIMVRIGQYVVVWGGSNAGMPVAGGGRYDAANDMWLPISNTNAPPPRLGVAFVSTGKELLTFGGRSGNTFFNELHTYDPELDQWKKLTPGGTAPPARYDAFAVWMNDALFVWDGMAGSTIDENGHVYNRTTNAWSAAGGGKPSKRAARRDRTGWSAWAPLANAVLVLGGLDGNNAKKDGGLFEPAMNAWGDDPGGWPSSVTHEWGAAVWTGLEMILWSGTTDGATLTAAGDRYMP